MSPLLGSPRSDGVLLTSYHALKNAREVQVRLKSGETFDRAVLMGVDERRDVAAVRISEIGWCPPDLLPRAKERQRGSGPFEKWRDFRPRSPDGCRRAQRCRRC